MFPILFHVYGFEVQSYPILLMMGGVLAAWLFAHRCIKKRLMLRFMNDHILYIVLSTFLLSRIGGIIESWSLYSDNVFMIFNIFDANFNFYAGFLGCILSLLYFTNKKQEPFWKWLDILSKSFILFYAMVAVANFAAGKCYGVPTQLPWAVSFNLPEVRYTIPVHPVQLYEAALLGFVLLFLLFIQRKKQYDGVVASYAFLSFFLIQALMTVFQGSPDILIFGLKLHLVFSLLAASVFLVILILRSYPNIHWFHNEQ